MGTKMGTGISHWDLAFTIPSQVGAVLLCLSTALLKLPRTVGRGKMAGLLQVLTTMTMVAMWMSDPDRSQPQPQPGQSLCHTRHGSCLRNTLRTLACAVFERAGGYIRTIVFLVLLQITRYDCGRKYLF